LLVDADALCPSTGSLDDVWDGCPPATSPRRCRYVSELRKVPASVLRTSGGGYVVDVDGDELDPATSSGSPMPAIKTPPSLWRGMCSPTSVTWRLGA
jgi:hypothetical protein